MKFIDLEPQRERIRQLLDERIAAVLDHGRFIQGPEVYELERVLSEYSGSAYSLACSSGTDALLMSLMAFGVKPGDAVFIPSFTFVATAEVVCQLGATPVFVDIDPDTCAMCPDALERCIQALGSRAASELPAGGLSARGIIAVDLFGQPADYQRLNGLAEKYNLFLLADAAQSFGATQSAVAHGTGVCRVGKLAPITTTSFFPSKPLGCYGDGGAVFVQDERLYEILKSIREHGQGSERYRYERVGINGRLDSLQAAVLLAKLTIFGDELCLRNEVAERYHGMLSGMISIPRAADGSSSSWAQYCVRSSKRSDIIRVFKEAGIPHAVYYEVPLHLQTVYREKGLIIEDLRNSEQVAREILALPFYPYIPEGAQEEVANAIRVALGH